jgi:hypothetical protein
MEEVLKIQEEFENLISELENLKQVNQLTSENTQNTKEVISAITSFVDSVKSFKLVVTEDYEAKKSAFENVVELLNSSFEGIDENTIQQSNKLTKLLKDTKNSMTQEIYELKVKVKATTDEYIESLKEVNSNIQESIELFTKKTVDSIGGREVNLVSQIVNIDRKIDLLELEFNKTNENIELFNNKISNSIEKKLNILKSQIDNGLESVKLNQEKLKYNLEEQQKLSNDLIFAEIKRNREEITISRILNIIMLIIIIGMIIYLITVVTGEIK